MSLFRLFIKFFLLAAILVFPQAGLCKAEKSDEQVSLRFKIGQMIMAGFMGFRVDDGDPIVKDIEERHLGGVILFDFDLRTGRPRRNVETREQLKKLIVDLKAHSDGPLLVAVDYEGGKINRLKERFGFPSTFSHEELGKIDNPKLTYKESLKMAETLREVGFNLNLAPVADIMANEFNPVIAKLDRSFAKSPDKVAEHALAFIKGHRDQGILTSLKHFPGHGSSSSDSHLEMTDVTKSWTRSELIPFKKIIEEGKADTIMTAHVFNARLDQKYPATLSKKTVTGLLRKELGFNGVVFSDDLGMKAIVDNYSLETVLLKTINAGVDIVITAYNRGADGTDIVGDIFLTIERLVKEGKISQKRIDESYERIKRLKERIKGVSKNSIASR